ncbi:MAG: Nif3-like dinuclear metal center hexameric protein [Clostridia bacterium]|nr:Nif3-like dinuclear metal center hexameric protein [Clostridia bacterium]
MNVKTLHDELTGRWPKTLSAAWDNDGIMSSPDVTAEVKRVLVALDATHAVIRYAVENGFDTVITHHPMIFKGAKNVTPVTLTGRRIVDSLVNGVSVLSFHTRLDAADGGVNDELCRALGFEVYESFGDDEMPTLGRIAEIPAMTAGELAELVKTKLGCTAVRVNGDCSQTVSRVALCGGDGKEFVYPALAAGCQAYITGDAGYNMAEDAAEDGLVTIEVGHYHSEAPVCRVIAEAVRELTGIDAEFVDSCGYRII